MERYNWRPVWIGLSLGLFVAIDLDRARYYLGGGPWAFAGDGRVSALAVHAWLGGMDPWAVADHGARLTAPPPVLLALAPLGLVPVELGAVLLVVLAAVAGVYSIWRLRLPWYWLLFPPLLDGVYGGNPNAIVLALLLTEIPVLGALAALFKVWAIAPLVGMRQWRALALTVGAVILSVPFLPWSTYLADRPSDIWVAQNGGGWATWGLPLSLTAGLVILLALGLLALGLHRASWLAIPLLLPVIQFHYWIFALPVIASYVSSTYTIASRSIVAGLRDPEVVTCSPTPTS